MTTVRPSLKTKNPIDLFSVKNKVVVITGGSGKLGHVQVQGFLKAGAKVISLDCNKNPKLPSSCQQYVVDITKKSSIEATFKIIKKKYKYVDVLINNAGLDIPPTNPQAGRVPFDEFPESEWDRVMDVNLKGMLFCSQVIGRDMAKRGKGSIINFGSIYGILSPDQRIYSYLRKKGMGDFVKPVVYSASKSGVLNLTRYMATYWGHKGVRVNTIVPGGVFNKQDPRFLKGYNAKVPLGRMAFPEELLGALIYLSSDASSYVTGASLVIDGGYSAW